VLEVDVQNFFDTLDHEVCRELLRQRVCDGVIVRLVGKWLNAGVLENGVVKRSDDGTPQGGVISPLLANIYLHHVLDDWWVRDVLPRMRGDAFLIRYADDFVLCFEHEDDARRVQAALGERFQKYGLTLHPTKTRLLPFARPWGDAGTHSEPGQPRSFDFLGFTHYWGKTRKGGWAVKRKTAKSRLTRAVRAVAEWCRENRHKPLATQAEQLTKKIKGHYAYYGVTGNFRALVIFLYFVQLSWWKCLRTRSQRTRLTADTFYHKLLARYPMPRPRVVHSAMSAAKL
jgi:group II intron reverse transcriptase/maturase